MWNFFQSKYWCMEQNSDSMTYRMLFSSLFDNPFINHYRQEWHFYYTLVETKQLHIDVKYLILQSFQLRKMLRSNSILSHSYTVWYLNLYLTCGIPLVPGNTICITKVRVYMSDSEHKWCNAIKNSFEIMFHKKAFNA